MRIVRTGITRTVILTRRYAIKVPSLRPGCGGPRGRLWSFTRGVLANLSEAEWSGTPGTCPVLRSWMWGLVNVYPRLDPVVMPESWIDYKAIGLLGPGDNKRDNLGWLGARMVFVDYDMSTTDCLACKRHGFQQQQRQQQTA